MKQRLLQSVYLCDLYPPISRRKYVTIFLFLLQEKYILVSAKHFIKVKGVSRLEQGHKNH